MRTTCLALLSLVASAACAQPRQSLDLGGEWQFVKVKDLATGPPAEGWGKITVPGVLNGFDYERAWFRRDFTIPATMQGARIEITFGGVKWNSIVRVNGQQVGGHYGGYEPFTVDITNVAKAGQTNTLELGCHDWTGVFADNKTDFSILKQRPMEVRDIPRDEILSPVGGLVTQYGPWDRVTLQSHPAVYVKDVTIKTSVRQKKLTVEYVLANATQEPANVRLMAAVERPVTSDRLLPIQDLTIPAGGETKATLEYVWQNPHLWSPEDPHLEVLWTELLGKEKSLDQLETRFGFREFWVGNGHFYLNGAREAKRGSRWSTAFSFPRSSVQRTSRCGSSGPSS